MINGSDPITNLTLIQFVTNSSREQQNALFPQWSLQEILPPNYNNQQPPTFNGAPVEVEVNLSILSFQRINENEQSFVADVFLHQKWLDRRLTLPRGFNPKKKLVLNSNWLTRIWTPSINFRNARSSSIATAINPTLYVTLNNNSEVFVAAKMSLDLKCKMNFAKYPFDSHSCYIEITSRKLKTNTNHSVDTNCSIIHSFLTHSRSPCRCAQLQMG